MCPSTRRSRAGGSGSSSRTRGRRSSSPRNATEAQSPSGACGERGITVASLPTAYWHELTSAIHAEALTVPPSLRLVIIGGEAALAARLAEWRRSVGPSPRLLNTYGPTEATVVATSCQPGD